MYWGIVVIFILILLIVFILIYNKPFEIEGYYDLAPYEFHWNMFKCYDMECLKNKTRKCYEWCDNIGETGGRHNCRMRCLDYSDQDAVQLKFNNYTFGRILPRFKYFSLHRSTKDWH